MPWSAPFDEVIRLPGGRRLTTLQDAADYIMKLPEKVQHQEPWQIAVENLINAAETGGGWRCSRGSRCCGRSTRRDSGRLFQRRVYRTEFGIELGSDALNRRDDRECDPGGDQTIFDSR
jgi:hypothetical protein